MCYGPARRQPLVNDAPPITKVKDLLILKLHSKLVVRSRCSRSQETSRDAAGFVQPVCAARPAGSCDTRRSAGRTVRAAAAAPGALHVVRHHPATCMSAPAARGASALPVWTGTLQRPPAYLSCRVQADNWSPAPRNV